MAQDLQDLHQKASEAMAEGAREKAIELYNKILEEAPGDEIAHGQLMDLYFDTDKFKYYLMRANLKMPKKALWVLQKKPLKNFRTTRS